MSDLKICRICLRTECKVYRYDRFQLKSYYEEVLALKVNEKEGLPCYFCYECATILHKFHKFKEKCYVGLQTLREISWRGPITYEAIYKIDRKAKNLISPIEILTTARKRVKTYNNYSSEDTDDSDEDSEPETDEETPVATKNNPKEPIETIDMSYLSDDSVNNDHNEHNVNNDSETHREGKIKIYVHKYENKQVIDDEITETGVMPPELEDELLIADVPCKPKQPETIFVSENDTSIIQDELPDVKRQNSAQKKQNIVKREPKFVKKPNTPKKWYVDLSPDNWKKSSLSEEEALERFRKKAEDPKYIKAPYKCSDCFKGFSKVEMLKRHILLRHDERNGAVECRFCKMRFKWDCMLRKHMRTHYAKYECLHCGLVCAREQSAMLHDGYHSGRKKICAHCGDEFKHLSTYYTHLRTHRSTHICTFCGASFVSPMGLQMHKKLKHVGADIDSPDEDAPVNTFCDKCDINFETRKAYEEHLFHSAMHSSNIVEDSTEDPVLANPPRKALGKKLQAKITDELNGKFTKIDGFDVAPERKRMRHRRKVERFRRKPTTCYQCGKHFETQSACMKHHLAEHPRTSFCPPSQRHICEFCGASLAPGSVAAHQNMHLREKTHPCEICGRDFFSSVGLKRHMVTHTGEKPYPCMLCDKRFTQSNSMKLHYRTFHLKQPYPKRNRRKKKGDQPETERRSLSSSESGSQSATETAAAAPQYITLNTTQFTATML